jgi:sugar/nucleoside kinase (ribokinase family)
VSAITVLAGTGERSVVSIDASGFAVSDIAPLDLLFDGADVALIDGHHQALSERAGRTARACRVPVVVDAGRWRPAMPSLLAGAHTVICSAEFRVPGAVDAETSARGLVEQGVPTVAVTHGGEPIDWWAGGRCGRIAPPRVDVVDTAGAGDACHGAYAYAVAAFPSSTVERRLAFAARVASLKCAFAGTRSWLTELKGRGIDALW